MAEGYPDRETIITALAEAATRAAAREVALVHPEDIATTMVAAIEHGGLVIEALWEEGKL